MDQRHILHVALLYVAATASGYALTWLHVPLPWMIGPMMLAAVAGMLGKTPAVPWITRPVGQLVVAASVGLFFTPAAVTAVTQQLVPMLAVAVLTIVAGFVAASLLMRLTRIDVITASLASIPGGPVEMAALAARHGAQPGPVAFAQILRIALLVVIIPPLLVAADGTTNDVSGVLSDRPVDYPGAALLLVVAVGGGVVMRTVGMISPFFLGPLAATAAASSLTLPVSAPPYFVLATAQVLLGVWLGCMFDRSLITRAGSFVPAVFASTALLLLLCAGMAFSITAMTGVEWQTMVLATAPGSVTEMALTAKLLGQGVALVTAFHVLRIFIILPSLPVIFALVGWLAKRSRTKTQP